MVSVGIEVTAEKPQEEESARVCQDSERIGHVQAERIDLVLHIWSRVQQELKRKIQLIRLLNEIRKARQFI